MKNIYQKVKRSMKKGNEKDCICEKPNGKHRKYCDAYRLLEFFKKVASIKPKLREV